LIRQHIASLMALLLGYLNFSSYQSYEDFRKMLGNILGSFKNVPPGY